MVELARYFEGAKTVAAADRQVGLEVETLFVDSEGVPLRTDGAEAVFATLEELGWSRDRDAKAGGRELRCDGFAIKPEVGAGNLELISPPRPLGELDALLGDLGGHLESLYSAASTVGARPLFEAHDGAPGIDNIILDNERDRLWAELDGREALRELAHIASVHVTFDLCSIDEGFACIRALNQLADEREWPPVAVREAWARYLNGSRLTYAPERFGAAPETFGAYLDQLRAFRVVVDRTENGELFRVEPPRSLGEVEGEVDAATFLGTVWFHTRLRRCGGSLALEVRFIPRRDDAALAGDVRAVLACVSMRSG